MSVRVGDRVGARVRMRLGLGFGVRARARVGVRVGVTFISSIDATKSVTNIQTYPFWRKFPHAHEIDPQAPRAVSQGSGEASSRKNVGTKPSTSSTTTASSPEAAQMRGGMHMRQPINSDSRPVW